MEMENVREIVRVITPKLAEKARSAQLAAIEFRRASR